MPRYLYGHAGGEAPAHVGSRDVDLAVILMVDDPASKSYETLARNLLNAGFHQAPLADDPDFRWRKEVDGVSLILEFICDTDEAEPGRNFKPRSGSGSRFQAFNVRGARLVSLDHKRVEISAERLDGGGAATARVQVAGLLPFVVLKVSAFVDRHHDKDAYDLIWSLANHPGGPEGAGREMAASPVIANPLAVEGLAVLRERFADARNDAPTAYAAFLDVTGDFDAAARLRNEAVETVRIALDAFDSARESAE